VGGFRNFVPNTRTHARDARLMDARSLTALKRRLAAYHRERTARWAAYNQAADAAYARLAATGEWTEPPPPPGPSSVPDELRALPCGARTRAGTPCKLTSIHLNGRCKLHGGLSTGPTPPDGIARARANLKRRWNPVKTSEKLRLEQLEG
jgi:hypothetical protein